MPMLLLFPGVAASSSPSTASMSASMLAQVLRLNGLFLSEAGAELARNIGATMPAAPMSTYTKDITFEITTPQDGAREFVFALSISEQSSPDGSPTAGYGITTQ